MYGSYVPNQPVQDGYTQALLSQAQKWCNSVVCQGMANQQEAAMVFNIVQRTYPEYVRQLKTAFPEVIPNLQTLYDWFQPALLQLLSNVRAGSMMGGGMGMAPMGGMMVNPMGGMMQPAPMMGGNGWMGNGMQQMPNMAFANMAGSADINKWSAQPIQQQQQQPVQAVQPQVVHPGTHQPNPGIPAEEKAKIYANGGNVQEHVAVPVAVATVIQKDVDPMDLGEYLKASRTLFDAGDKTVVEFSNTVVLKRCFLTAQEAFMSSMRMYPKRHDGYFRMIQFLRMQVLDIPRAELVGVLDKIQDAINESGLGGQDRIGYIRVIRGVLENGVSKIEKIISKLLLDQFNRYTSCGFLSHSNNYGLSVSVETLDEAIELFSANTSDEGALKVQRQVPRFQEVSERIAKSAFKDFIMNLQVLNIDPAGTELDSVLDALRDTDYWNHSYDGYTLGEYRALLAKRDALPDGKEKIKLAQVTEKMESVLKSVSVVAYREVAGFSNLGTYFDRTHFGADGKLMASDVIPYRDPLMVMLAHFAPQNIPMIVDVFDHGIMYRLRVGYSADGNVRFSLFK